MSRRRRRRAYRHSTPMQSQPPPDQSGYNNNYASPQPQGYFGHGNTGYAQYAPPQGPPPPQYGEGYGQANGVSQPENAYQPPVNK